MTSKPCIADVVYTVQEEIAEVHHGQVTKEKANATMNRDSYLRIVSPEYLQYKQTCQDCIKSRNGTEGGDISPFKTHRHKIFTQSRKGWNLEPNVIVEE
ncbi:hypothetical protein EYC80_001395 [Monilinia laxa]|uniref:Uncharacterized protein n=1 Tax=Monilinia laxa TaxID=61186 RepID=A0A5N6K952_MONLA|nr:hypothetical protein EYC80_001395 [Monilinia laxa]